jgi:hypothetical protein
VDADAAAGPLSFAYYELTADDKPRWDEECRVVLGDIDHNPHLSDAGRARFLKRFAKDPLKLAASKSAGGCISRG